MDKDSQKILEEMKQAQAKQQQVMAKTGQAPRGGKPSEKKATSKNQQPIKPQDSEDKAKKLEAEVRSLKSKNADLNNQLRSNSEATKYDQAKSEQEALLKNKDAYHFVKEYTVSTKDGKSNKFVVKMHAPSITEQAQIQQEFVDLTGARGQAFVSMAQELFLAIGYFRVVGDNVPVWFTDVDKTYRTDVLLEVWGDYQDWLNDWLDEQQR